MAKSGFTVLAVALAFALPGVPAMGQASGDSQPDFKTSFLGGALTCSQAEKVTVPKSVEKRARLKAKLLNLLRESLYDDSKGIMNLEREREIASLANKLKEEKQH